nr:ATP-binding protein [uncultured Microbacterium sp.]
MNPSSARGRGPLSLQARLMAAVTGFVSLVLVVIAIATSVVLGNVLNGRLQDELVSAGKGIAAVAMQRTVLSHSLPDASDLVVGQTGVQTGTLVMVVTENSATGTFVSADHVAQDLSPLQMNQVITALSQNRYAQEIAGLGDYQFSHQTIRAAPGYQIITGLPRAATEAQITTLFSVIAITTIAGLILLALSTAITIRLALRPLREVAATANRVANLPLDRGDVSISERVPASEADPRTETGLVGAALNTLLDHVDASLSVRQRNEERMRQFVADASHELRTPLSSIRGYSELSLRALASRDPGVPEDPATASAHTALERIQAQSLRMTSLVEDLLLLARLEEGRELTLSTVDLSRLAIEGVEDARPTAPEHHWAIEVPEEPVEIIGDTGRLQQVVTNLLANARTHTPAGTRIAIAVAEDGDHAVLRVSDDGPGIDPAVRDELFSRFARGDRSRNRATGGSGLGLSITKAIVDGHGGTISVQSEPGSTVFTVRLPRTPETAAETAVAEGTDRPSRGGHDLDGRLGGR